MVYTLIKDGLSIQIIFQKDYILPETFRDKKGNVQSCDGLLVDRKYFVMRESLKDKFVEWGLKQGILKVDE